MQHTPPPLFNQGPSARARLAFFAVLALALLVLDARLKLLGPVRQAVATTLYPVQKTMLVPRDMWRGGAAYFTEQTRLIDENDSLKRAQVQSLTSAARIAQLQSDNQQLRKLMDLREERLPQSVLAEVLYDTRDPFVRHLVLGKGGQQGIAPGMPVLDAVGVVGQVTRVTPFTSEINLLTDKDQAIPVQVIRNGLRAVAYGGQEAGLLDIRWLAVNADIQEGDMLTTSGIDGVYPAGLPVAQVVKVERAASVGFARILCKPLAGLTQHRYLVVLLANNAFPAPPPKAEELPGRPTKKSRVQAPGELPTTSERKR
jgi:rod shape-determining protein MreC